MGDLAVYFVLAGVLILSALGIYVLRTPRRAQQTSSEAITSVDLEPFLKFDSIEVADFAPSSLAEVKDSKVVARLDALLTPAVELAAKVTSPSLKNAYRVFLPPGAELEKSTHLKGMFRGFFKDGNRIAGHADLAKLDPSKAAAIANVAANAMNVSALVVGQQFMAEISSKLDSINDNLNAITDRLDAQLMSSVQSELVLISEISEFRAEILESPEERNRRLISLDSHETKLADVLSQVNILLDKQSQRFEGRQGSKGVKAYQELVHELQGLSQQQEILVALMGEVSNLKYILGAGEKSLASSSAVFKS